MYLLDTNICVALLRGDRQAERRFTREFPQCYTSALVIAELYKGVYVSQQIEQNLKNLETFAELLTVEVFDRAAAAEFGKIQAEQFYYFRQETKKPGFLFSRNYWPP